MTPPPDHHSTDPLRMVSTVQMVCNKITSTQEPGVQTFEASPVISKKNTQLLCVNLTKHHQCFLLKPKSTLCINVRLMARTGTLNSLLSKAKGCFAQRCMTGRLAWNAKVGQAKKLDFRALLCFYFFKHPEQILTVSTAGDTTRLS